MIVLFTPASLALTVGVAVTVTGPLPAIYDTVEMAKGDRTYQRIAKIALGILMCASTAMVVTGYFTAMPPLLISGGVLLALSAITRLILQIIYDN